MLYRYFLLVTIILTSPLINNICSGAKILIINNVGLRSHANVFSSYIEVLSNRGHDITYLSTLMHEGKASSQITQHQLFSKVIQKNIKYFNGTLSLLSRIFPSSRFYISAIDALGEEPCTYLENEAVQNIIKTSKTYDVALINGYSSECFMALAYMKNIPVILITTTIPAAWHNTALGIENNYGLDKYLYLNYPNHNLFHRIHDILAGNMIYAYRNWFWADGVENWLSLNLPSHKFPPFHQLQSNISLLMMNTIPEMGYVRLTVPKLIEVGGMHCRPSKKLPEHIEEFISGAGEHGVVYLSLGATLNPKFVPKHVLQGFIDVFKDLPQRVIWKWSEELSNVPENVLVSSWFPQQDILGDPRLRVFVTQGGMLSLQEAVFHGVPVLAIPFISDQYLNTRIMQNMGYGLELDLESFSVVTFRQHLQRVINEKHFKVAAKKLSDVVKDAPKNTTEKAVWWIEYVIRNRGTKYLNHPMEMMPWYQQKQLDVQIIFWIALFMFFLVWFVLIKLLLKCFRKHIFCNKVKLKKT